MNAKNDKIELKLNKSNLKNLTLDEKVLPKNITGDVYGGNEEAFAANTTHKTSMTTTHITIG